MMTSRFGGKYLLALAITAAALASGNTARAHDEGEGEGKGEGEGHHKGGGHHGEGHGDEGGGGEGEGGEHGQGDGKHGHGKHHPHAHSGIVGLDLVLGFGKGPLAIQNPPSSLGTLPTYSKGEARSMSESFILGAAFHLLPHTAFGIRVPFTFGQFYPAGNTSRGLGALGNIELEAEYERHMGKGMELFFVMGFSLPTAQGEEIPEDLDTRTNGQVDQASYDKGALNRAASLSRGGEETALFEPKRFGLNPKIGLNYRSGKITITPYIKMENLIATSPTLAHGYLGELVPAVRAGYRMGHVEPALKLWAPIIFAGGNEGEKKVGFVIEPQVVFHHGNVRPVLGVIIPLAGPATDPQFIGVRLAVAAVF